MNDSKNTILAIVLSGLVLLIWQYFFGLPYLEKQKQAQQPPQQQSQPVAGAPTRPQEPGSAAQLPTAPATGQPEHPLSRGEALAKSPRIALDTPRIRGSIALTGGRIDDVALKQYHETIDPNSPNIELLSPSGSPHPFYAEFGWLAAPGSATRLPGSDTVWRQQGSGSLGVDRPVTLTWDNGEGLEFRRTISVDDKYLFSVRDEVINKGQAPVTLSPYALISRHGTPPTLGYYILHEGLIGELGDKLEEVTYKTIDDKKTMTFTDARNGWLGFTDKYWASTLLPDTSARLQASFTAGTINTLQTYQTAYVLDAQTPQPGGTAAADARLFAGAKEVTTIDAYAQQLKLNNFDKLIDWGYLYFITKPMFKLIDYFYRLVGNFGVAILIVTVLVKLLFFPLANKAYASMAKMKALQPQMQGVRERYPDDKVKQQQEMMELYKKEKINPLAGCLPIVIQIPVFFSLYKVLFITIEMRHAPFFGWIKDLSAPDPTTVFNLFGLIPWDPSHLPLLGPFLMLGAWPLVMGFTMWLQMKLNPAPPDPTQKMMMDWMPVIFTFMLASFSAGLVIYWAWNNLLSVIQQSIIMHKNGAKIELFDNLKSLFARRKPQS
ncbi:MAG: membrane protein insertase YidC [Alphaproteobacteria bacterium]|nr:MAG: membrane protein insertase YidC [Alphaproteobacteria bacterium]